MTIIKVIVADAIAAWTVNTVVRAQRQKHKEDSLYLECPKAIKLESLNKPIIDSEGHTTELGELIADDKTLDLDAWVDFRDFLPATKWHGWRNFF